MRPDRAPSLLAIGDDVVILRRRAESVLYGALFGVGGLVFAALIVLVAEGGSENFRTASLAGALLFAAAGFRFAWRLPLAWVSRGMMGVANARGGRWWSMDVRRAVRVRASQGFGTRALLFDASGGVAGQLLPHVFPEDVAVAFERVGLSVDRVGARFRLWRSQLWELPFVVDGGKARVSVDRQRLEVVCDGQVQTVLDRDQVERLWVSGFHPAGVKLRWRSVDGGEGSVGLSGLRRSWVVRLVWAAGWPVPGWVDVDEVLALEEGKGRLQARGRSRAGR